jgi:hypothetical protein
MRRSIVFGTEARETRARAQESGARIEGRRRSRGSCRRPHPAERGRAAQELSALRNARPRPGRRAQDRISAAEPGSFFVISKRSTESGCHSRLSSLVRAQPFSWSRENDRRGIPNQAQGRRNPQGNQMLVEKKSPRPLNLDEIAEVLDTLKMCFEYLEDAKAHAMRAPGCSVLEPWTPEGVAHAKLQIAFECERLATSAKGGPA